LLVIRSCQTNMSAETPQFTEVLTFVVSTQEQEAGPLCPSRCCQQQQQEFVRSESYFISLHLEGNNSYFEVAKHQI